MLYEWDVFLGCWVSEMYMVNVLLLERFCMMLYDRDIFGLLSEYDISEDFEPNR